MHDGTPNKSKSPSKARTIIFSANDKRLFASICKVYPLVSPHKVAQVALRCGLRIIAGDPPRLVQEAQDVRDDVQDAAAVSVGTDRAGGPR
jgi:hypothetical protein